jgi:acetyl esterase/lipase
MQQVKGGSIWERPVRSLSPMAVIDGIAPSTGVWMLVGSDDQVTPPALTLAYAEALRSRGGTVNVTVAPGLPHNLLLEPVTIDRLKEVIGVNGAGR